jgi:hypothetical protein
MAKGIIKIVEKALNEGFASKGAKAVFSTEKSDYKDFVRMFVISDFFRYKTKKDRLGEIFSMLEENGAKDAIPKISLCITMTNREYKREFGPYNSLGPAGAVYSRTKAKPRVSRLSKARGRS